MPCLSTIRRAELLADIASKEAFLTTARATYQKALESGDIVSYDFQSGEGRQRTDLRSPTVLGEEVTRLEREIRRLKNKLNGGGVFNMTTRRRC